MWFSKNEKTKSHEVNEGDRLVLLRSAESETSHFKGGKNVYPRHQEIFPEEYKLKCDRIYRYYVILISNFDSK